MTNTTRNPGHLPGSGLVPGPLWYAHLKETLQRQAAYSFLGNVANRLARDPNTDPDTLDQLFDYATAGDGLSAGIVEMIAKNPATTSATLIRLLQRGFLRKAWGVAVAGRGDLDQLDDELLENLLDVWDDSVGKTLASNPSCPPSTLERLATRRECESLLSGNPATPRATLTSLAAKTENRIAMAANPSCPPELLARFAEHPGVNIVESLCKNPAADPAWLDVQAARSFNGQIRALRNPALPAATLERWVGNVAHGHLNEECVLALIQNPATTSDQLDRMYGSGQCPEGTWPYLAGVPHASRQLLDALVDTRIGPLGWGLSHVADSAYLVAAIVLHRGDLPAEFLLEQAPYLLAACDAGSSGLPALESDTAQRLLALVADWAGTLGELIESACLLAPQLHAPVA